MPMLISLMIVLGADLAIGICSKFCTVAILYLQLPYQLRGCRVEEPIS